MAVGATVFVVDDDPGIREAMRGLLESTGLVVETYSSAAEYLGAYNPNRPGCLVLDLRMPEIDGLELQRRLIAHGPHPPIVFVTAYGDVSQCAEAMKGGAVDFLRKPTDGPKLLDAVRRALERDQRRHRVEATHPQIAARLARLTPREREVMLLLLDGDDMKTIAGRLSIGIQTVAKHRTRVLAKMQVRNEAELVRLLEGYALER